MGGDCMRVFYGLGLGGWRGILGGLEKGLVKVRGWRWIGGLGFGLAALVLLGYAFDLVKFYYDIVVLNCQKGYSNDAKIQNHHQLEFSKHILNISIRRLPNRQSQQLLIANQSLNNRKLRNLTVYNGKLNKLKSVSEDNLNRNQLQEHIPHFIHFLISWKLIRIWHMHHKNEQWPNKNKISNKWEL